MANLSGLSDAHAILLATELCTAGNVAPLPLLRQQFPTSLNTEILLRIILTFLPESTPPQNYVSVIQSVTDQNESIDDSQSVDVSSVEKLSIVTVRKRVRKLKLLPLRYPQWEEDSDLTDALTIFLLHRAHRIDEETGLQTLILDLVTPFYQKSDILRTWLISRLLPLLRLNYEYYPSNDDIMSLDVFESMDRSTAINVLLSMTSPSGESSDLTRNLNGLVGPWMYGAASSKRRKLNPTDKQNFNIGEHLDDTKPEYSAWQEVNEWLLSRSRVDYERVVGAFTTWQGPDDVDLGGYDNEVRHNEEDTRNLKEHYVQTGLAVVYANADTNRSILDGSFQILSRIPSLLGIESEILESLDSPRLPDVSVDLQSISTATKASLLQNALLTRSNALTFPTSASISFLHAMLLSLRILGNFGHSTSCRAIATTCLQSNDEAQSVELRAVLENLAKQTKSGRDWRSNRRHVLWLRSWHNATGSKVESSRQDYHGVYWRVSLPLTETLILQAMLTDEDYRTPAEIYCNSTSSPLSKDQVEEAVTETIVSFYDNASNGNRSRGKMKKALDILKAFKPHFPDSPSFKQIEALISATHALSFYSLTLQHGVPFQPVSIRVHADPLSLLEKVLDQNPKSYTKLDDLLSIGRNMVIAGLPVPRPSHEDDHHIVEPMSQDEALVTAERRIMSMAVSSALSDDDFGTAYSYILTRLTPPSLHPSGNNLTSTSGKQQVEDDFSWRAAYLAGRHRSTTDQNLQNQITRLSQRMELLSLALVLAPTPEPLPEILGAWRRCDEEMNVLRATESEQAEEWDRRGDRISSVATRTVPGGFGPTDRELDAYENERHQANRQTRTATAARRLHPSKPHEDAPMGLFEVARGAAKAFSRNVNVSAFPLHSSTSTLSSKDGKAGDHHESEGHDHTGGPATGRIRKRDMVSNMVTGGLASGIGWVLGAQPVNLDSNAAATQEHDRE